MNNVPVTFRSVTVLSPNKFPISAENQSRILAASGAVSELTKLIPRHICEQVIAELEDSLTPAGMKTASAWAKMLMGAYPQKELRDPEVFALSVSFDLQEFPADVIEATVHHVRRTCRFTPTCADVYDAATKLLSERTTILRRCQAHLYEHKRRLEAKTTSPRPKQMVGPRPVAQIEKQAGAKVRHNYEDDETVARMRKIRDTLAQQQNREDNGGKVEESTEEKAAEQA